MSLKTLTILGQKPSALRKELVAAGSAIAAVGVGAAAFTSSLPGWAQVLITGLTGAAAFLVTVLTKGASIIDATDNI